MLAVYPPYAPSFREGSRELTQPPPGDFAEEILSRRGVVARGAGRSSVAGVPKRTVSVVGANGFPRGRETPDRKTWPPMRLRWIFREVRARVRIQR